MCLDIQGVRLGSSTRHFLLCTLCMLLAGFIIFGNKKLIVFIFYNGSCSILTSFLSLGKTLFPVKYVGFFACGVWISYLVVVDLILCHLL